MSSIDPSTSLFVDSKLIPISMMLLFVNVRTYKCPSRNDFHIVFESPRVNCRHMSAGRIKREEYKKDDARATKFVTVLSRKVDDSEQSETYIYGMNVFSPKGNKPGSVRFDFTLNTKEVCYPLFLLSTDLPDGASYATVYEEYTQEVSNRSVGNGAMFFYEVLIKFSSKYNNFKNTDDFDCLITNLSKFSPAPEDVGDDVLNRVPVTLQAVIRFQSFCRARLCIVDANHRIMWYLCAAFGIMIHDANLFSTDVSFVVKPEVDSSHPTDGIVEHDMNIISVVYQKPDYMSNDDCVSIMVRESNTIQSNISKTTPFEIYHP
jgi:hypothetical protein